MAPRLHTSRLTKWSLPNIKRGWTLAQPHMTCSMVGKALIGWSCFYTGCTSLKSTLLAIRRDDTGLVSSIRCTAALHTGFVPQIACKHTSTPLYLACYITLIWVCFWAVGSLLERCPTIHRPAVQWTPSKYPPQAEFTTWDWNRPGQPFCIQKGCQWLEDTESWFGRMEMYQSTWIRFTVTVEP